MFADKTRVDAPQRWVTLNSAASIVTLISKTSSFDCHHTSNIAAAVTYHVRQPQSSARECQQNEDHDHVSTPLSRIYFQVPHGSRTRRWVREASWKRPRDALELGPKSSDDYILNSFSTLLQEKSSLSKVKCLSRLLQTVHRGRFLPHDSASIETSAPCCATSAICDHFYITCPSRWMSLKDRQAQTSGCLATGEYLVQSWKLRGLFNLFRC